jgi:YgiT-type zinc finger domain-containing protein
MDEKQAFQVTQAEEISRKLSQWERENPDATFTDIEEAVEAELAQLRKRLVEEMLQQKEAAAQDSPTCPRCGEEMVKNGRRRRRVKGKEGQTVELNRQQWRCLVCGETLFPPG